MSQVLITGLGVTGDATARALVKIGYEVTVFEERDDSRHRELAKELGALGIHVTFDIPEKFPPLVITSPGWKPEHPILLAALEHGAHVMGEIEFSFMHDQQQLKAGKSAKRIWLGVTGTNGKTSTVGMVESIIKAAGKSAIVMSTSLLSFPHSSCIGLPICTLALVRCSTLMTTTLIGMATSRTTCRQS